MTTNPYRPPESPEGSTQPPRRRAWAWWLVVAGPLLAIGGVAAPVVAYVAAFSAVANSPKTPSPALLADGIAKANLLALGGIFLALLGLGLTIAGILLLVLRPKSPGGGGTPR